MDDKPTLTGPALFATVGKSWQSALEREFRSPYFEALKVFLDQERAEHTIYPSEQETFTALQRTPYHSVRVVLLGQDPYHGAGQAHGLAFSVPEGVPQPPSLRNIFKELQRDLGRAIPDHGNLSAWADQGVLLLNTTLTVREGQAGSHYGQGWERFTDAIISELSAEREGLVFLLWGRNAQQKAGLINGTRHHVLLAPHPSPLSAHRGFFGCGHFGQVNALLREKGGPAIDWSIR